MPLLLFLLMIAGIGWDWFETAKVNKKHRYLSKPLSVALIIGVFLTQIESIQSPVWIFLLGLLLGLGGDILLMFQDDKWFMAGLGSFLLGHIAYIIGFFSLGKVEPIWLALLLLVPIAMIVGAILRPLLKATDRKMEICILAYGVVIGTMLFSTLCLLFNPAWDRTASILAVAGAGLFVTSDALLASWKFLGKNSEFWPMVTYHLAQIAIAASVVVQFAK